MAIFEKMAELKLNRLIVLPNDSVIEETGWVADKMREMGHEKVVIIYYPKANLKACIAIHDGTLGKERIGGIRFFPYDSEEKFILDILGLAQTMTKKASMADLNRGGAKSGIWGDPKNDKTVNMLLKFAEEVELLGGDYIAAEDMGISVADLGMMRRITKHVGGLPEAHLEYRNGRFYRGSGEPGIITGRGCNYGIKAALRFKEMGGVRGKKVAIEGLGSVGFRLARFLHQEGAILIGCDTDPERVRHFEEEFRRDASLEFKESAKIVEPEKIFEQECDVFAPCAGSGVINDENIRKLKCKIVAGSANNPLTSDKCGKTLMERGILYAPDFVVNAGGLINVDDELKPDGYSENRVLNRIANVIPKNLFKIFLRSDTLGIPTDEVANAMAQERIELKREKIRILSNKFKKPVAKVAEMLEKEDDRLEELMRDVFKQ